MHKKMKANICISDREEYPTAQHRARNMGPRNRRRRWLRDRFTRRLVVGDESIWLVESWGGEMI